VVSNASQVLLNLLTDFDVSPFLPEYIFGHIWLSFAKEKGCNYSVPKKKMCTLKVNIPYYNVYKNVWDTLHILSMYNTSCKIFNSVIPEK
jgi:hypothetical protein